MKTVIQGKVDPAIGARFKALQEEKTFNNFIINLLNAYEEHSKLKSASKPEIYSFFNDMAKDGKCAICNGNTWLKRCIGQKNEDGSKSYFHEKCWEELKYDEDPELYKRRRKLREIKTEIAQGQKLLKDIDRQTVLADLKIFLMKVGKEGGFSVSKEEHYQLLSIVTKLEKPVEPTKTESLIEDNRYTFIQKNENPYSKGKPLLKEMVYCPIRKLNRSAEKCDECKEQIPQTWKSCEEDKKLNPDIYKPRSEEKDEKSPICTNLGMVNPETFREPFNGKW